MQIPSFEEVKVARARIDPYIHRTPVLTSGLLNELSGAELFFKCENFQKAGAFKVRGASNAVFGLDDEKARIGVATHSSGNHALSLSYAAGRRGIPVTVVMPRTAPQAKKDAVIGYGGRIVECEPSTSSREAVFAEVVAESGAEFVHPYNDPRVIAGQGTCSWELVGAGLRSRCGGRAHRRRRHGLRHLPDPFQHRTFDRNLRCGTQERRRCLRAPSRPGTSSPTMRPRPWPTASRCHSRNSPGISSQRHVTDILTAEEEEIIDAMKLIWKRMKIVMEPSSAVPWRPFSKTKTFSPASASASS